MLGQVQEVYAVRFIYAASRIGKDVEFAGGRQTPPPCPAESYPSYSSFFSHSIDTSTMFSRTTAAMIPHMTMF